MMPFWVWCCHRHMYALRDTYWQYCPFSFLWAFDLDCRQLSSSHHAHYGLLVPWVWHFKASSSVEFSYIISMISIICVRKLKLNPDSFKSLQGITWRSPCPSGHVDLWHQMCTTCLFPSYTHLYTMEGPMNFMSNAWSPSGGKFRRFWKMPELNIRI